MKPGVVVSLIVGALAASAMVVAFLSNASPYVTIAQARASNGTSLHLVGDLDKQTLSQDAMANRLRFELTDVNHDRIRVDFTGPAPANMGSATKVVVVGGVQEGVFRAHKIFVKCPTKYKGQS
jgi:cytochrome c-type biogenesis protein CcmE